MNNKFFASPEKFTQVHLRGIVTEPTNYILALTELCICENKGADQLQGNRTADECLCFHYIDITILLLSKSEILSL